MVTVYTPFADATAVPAVSAARAHRVFPRQTTRFKLLILMTYEVKPNDQGLTLSRLDLPSSTLPLEGLSITFEFARRGKSNNFRPRTERERDDGLFPFSRSLAYRVYNLRYCSFHGDEEGRRERRKREGKRDTSSEGIERQHDLIVARYGSRFHYLSLLYLQRLAPPVTLTETFSRPRNGLL